MDPSDRRSCPPVVSWERGQVAVECPGCLGGLGRLRVGRSVTLRNAAWASLCYIRCYSESPPGSVEVVGGSCEPRIAGWRDGLVCHHEAHDQSRGVGILDS